MPWTYDDPPVMAMNWTDGEIRRCVDAANAVLADGGADEEAIHACIAAAGKGQRTMREYKTSPHFVKEIADRTVVGLFAIHGNIDDGGDRSHPGAFADTAIAGRERVRFLWQHGGHEPPIAAINYVREIARADLPDKVLAYAPEATGAAEVSRTYLNTARGSEVLEGIRAGALDEMSYAYDVASHSITTEEESGKQIRELYKLKLWDISDVNWGMNAATTGVKGLDWKVQPIIAHAGAVETVIREFADRIAELKERRSKEGRMFSSANMTALTKIADGLSEIEQAMRDLLAQTEPKTSDRRATQRLYHEWQQLRRAAQTLGEHA